MNGTKKLLADISAKCIKNNITLKLISSPSVDVDSIECSGYFDETEMVVATQKKDWVDILLHEDCHLDQFLEKSKLWNSGDDGIRTLEKWLSNKHVSNKKIEQSIIDIILLELDCEKRTVNKIKKYKLDIDTKKYIQQANTYLFSYWATQKYRKWLPMPYNNKNLVKKFPNYFLKLSEYINPESKYVRIFG